MTQISAERLIELGNDLKTITDDLCTAIDVRTNYTNQLAIAKAQVEKFEHQKKLVEQQIMNEKKLIDTTR